MSTGRDPNVNIILRILSDEPGWFAVRCRCCTLLVEGAQLFPVFTSFRYMTHINDVIINVYLLFIFLSITSI